VRLKRDRRRLDCRAVGAAVLRIPLAREVALRPPVVQFQSDVARAGRLFSRGGRRKFVGGIHPSHGNLWARLAATNPGDISHRADHISRWQCTTGRSATSRASGIRSTASPTARQSSLRRSRSGALSTARDDFYTRHRLPCVTIAAMPSWRSMALEPLGAHRRESLWRVRVARGRPHGDRGFHHAAAARRIALGPSGGDRYGYRRRRLFSAATTWAGRSVFLG